MKTTTPYRLLSPERRTAILTSAMRNNRDARTSYAQRLVARGGGFRVATLLSWPVERLAREIVRLNAENAQDELELLQFLYVEHEPQTQITFLEAAGVPHENGIIPEELPAPYTDADGVGRGASAVIEAHGDDGAHYLRTIARHNAGAWPGIEEVVSKLS